MPGLFFEFLRQNPGIWFEFPEIRKNSLGRPHTPEGKGITISTRNHDADGNRYLTAGGTPGLKIWGRYDAPEQ